MATGTKCHRVGKSSPARRDVAWQEGSSTISIEGEEGVEAMQPGYSVTCGMMSREGYQ
jgi:hypothetical protein